MKRLFLLFCGYATYIFSVLISVKKLFISYSKIWNMIMQKSTMEKVYADECRKLKSQIAELEQKLKVATRSLNVAESNLAIRNAEVDSLQNSLKELDELREFKAVRDVYNYFCFLDLSENYIFFRFAFPQDVDRKNQQTAEILKRQGAQLVELENLYKQEQVLRKRYYNTIEGKPELNV
jgi:hypothetical protein